MDPQPLNFDFLKYIQTLTKSKSHFCSNWSSNAQLNLNNWLHFILYALIFYFSLAVYDCELHHVIFIVSFKNKSKNEIFKMSNIFYWYCLNPQVMQTSYTWCLTKVLNVGLSTPRESRHDHDKPLLDKFMCPLFLFNDLSKKFPLYQHDVNLTSRHVIGRSAGHTYCLFFTVCYAILDLKLVT